MKKETYDAMLGKEAIGKLLVKLSLPAVIALMGNGLYNLVDSIFVGQGVGVNAIGGLTIVFPFQMFIAALGGCIGIGTASIISRRLGEGHREAAYKTAGTALQLSFISGVFFTIIVYIFIRKILLLFGATEGLEKYAYDYLSLILIGNPFLIFTMSACSIARSEGRAMVAMIAMLIGVSGNIVLDPVFIFLFKMGIRGAALATIIAQFFSFLYLLYFFLAGRSSLKIKLIHLKFDWRISQKIFALGIPALIRQGGTSIVMVIVNNSLGKYGGEQYISIYGIILRTLMFLYMPILGIVQGFQPIVGYNYGAAEIARVKAVLRCTLLSTSLLSCLFFLILYLFSPVFFSFFTDDLILIETGVPVLRSIILILPLLGLQVVGSQFFLSIGKVIPSFFLGLSRQVIFLLPLIIVLPWFLKLDGIIYAFPLADFFSALITGIWLFVEIRSFTGKGKWVQGKYSGNLGKYR